MGELDSSLVAVAALGGFHGLNPGMGWLFAVALGMQQGHRRAVLAALGPLALGHGLAIGAVIGAAALFGFVADPSVMRGAAGLTLVGLGVYRLIRQRHPRWGGMRVGAVGLTTWSFVMASAHGAGLMVLPFVLGAAGALEASEHAAHVAGAGAAAGLTATIVHGAAYFAVTAATALLVFEKLGLGMLRKAWINVDLIWAGALVLTGALTLAL